MYERLSRVAIDEIRSEERHKEQVNQIHSERQARQFGNHRRSGFALDAREQKEHTESGNNDIRRAKFPSPLKHRSVDEHTRRAHHPKRPSGEQHTHHGSHSAYAQTLGAIPLYVHTHIVGKHQISEIARHIPEHAITIPETFTPHLGSDKLANKRRERRDEKQRQEHPFVARRRLFEPRRHHRNDEIDADERIHKPQMARHRWEIERQTSEVGKRLLPRHSTPSKRQERVGKHKHQHRRHHAQQATAVERRHSVALLHRHKQECRNYHKQRHTYASERAIVESHPKAIALIGKHRHIAGKPR